MTKKSKRQNDKKGKKTKKNKGEFHIETSGQFRTLAMFSFIKEQRPTVVKRLSVALHLNDHWEGSASSKIFHENTSF